ncbi:MAG: hypothetical protein ACM3SR_11470 [Ignavibacteriales bacterium]
MLSQVLSGVLLVCEGDEHTSKYVLYCSIKGILWFFVTTWARLAGFIDAILHLLDVEHKEPSEDAQPGAPGDARKWAPLNSAVRLLTLKTMP